VKTCHVRLLCVAFHEAFWAVVGGSAPVIALAAVVSIGDLSDLEGRIAVLEIRERHEQASPAPADGPAAARYSLRAMHRMTSYLILVHDMNVAMQAVLLAIALISLTGQTNWAAPWIAIAGEVAGVALLAVAQLLISGPRRWTPRVEARQKGEFGLNPNEESNGAGQVRE
jgi:hypothetical protein